MSYLGLVYSIPQGNHIHQLCRVKALLKDMSEHLSDAKSDLLSISKMEKKMNSKTKIDKINS